MLLPFCQDVMILDQSMFFGVADIHDRHRDMRLDVDNMSYEVNVQKIDIYSVYPLILIVVVM